MYKILEKEKKENNISVSQILKYYFPNNDLYKNSLNLVKSKKWEKSIYYQKFGNCEDPVFELMEYWKTKWDSYSKLGETFHYMIELFFSKTNFETNVILTELPIFERVLLTSFFNEFKIFLYNYSKWKICHIEKKFNYQNIYGKPDGVFLDNKQLDANNIHRNLIKYFEPYLKKNIKDFNVIEHDLDLENAPIENRRIIIDWKINTSRMFKKHNNRMIKHFKNIFFDTKYNKWVFQLNIYKYIIEKENKNIKISGLFILEFNIRYQKYNLIPIIFLKNSVINNIIKPFNFN